MPCCHHRSNDESTPRPRVLNAGGAAARKLRHLHPYLIAHSNPSSSPCGISRPILMSDRVFRDNRLAIDAIEAYLESIITTPCPAPWIAKAIRQWDGWPKTNRAESTFWTFHPLAPEAPRTPRLKAFRGEAKPTRRCRDRYAMTGLRSIRSGSLPENPRKNWGRVYWQ